MMQKYLRAISLAAVAGWLARRVRLDDDPITPTTTAATTTTAANTTQTFAGMLNKNGAATLPFQANGAGTVTATIKSIDPDATIAIGFAIGTWNGTACAWAVANDNALVGATLSGTTAGVTSLCVARLRRRHWATRAQLLSRHLASVDASSTGVQRYALAPPGPITSCYGAMATRTVMMHPHHPVRRGSSDGSDCASLFLSVAATLTVATIAPAARR
jgi:hypothetical protein